MIPMKKLIGCFVCFFLVVFCVRADSRSIPRKADQQKQANIQKKTDSGTVKKKSCSTCCAGKSKCSKKAIVVTSGKSAKSSKSAKKKKTKKKNNFQYMTIDERLKSFQK